MWVFFFWPLYYKGTYIYLTIVFNLFQVVRNPHPQVTSSSDDKTSLNAKDKEWRKACAAAIGLVHDQVGTLFIYLAVSTL